MKYLLRLDDASPFMEMKKWRKTTEILNKYNIKPLVGIVPNNQDSQIKIKYDVAEYQSLLTLWKNHEWQFALHGYNHVYCSNSGGINPIHKRSEFAGVKYEDQYEKLKSGYDLLLSQGVIPKYFYAPSHTFDENTLKALVKATPIRIISDTFALKPYKLKDITVIPQQLGKFRAIIIPGTWTFCYHPNNMSDSDFIEFELFLKKYNKYFITFPEIQLPVRNKGLLDRSISLMYLVFRKIFR